MEVDLIRDGKVIRVDSKGPCGRQFVGIAIIHEPDSENPGLEVPRPLGLNAIRQILIQFAGRRAGE